MFSALAAILPFRKPMGAIRVPDESWREDMDYERDQQRALDKAHAHSFQLGSVGSLAIDSPFVASGAHDRRFTGNNLLTGAGSTSPSPDAVVKRIASRPDGMFGVLLLRHATGLLPFCLTLEDPWNDNKPKVSCIPSGWYVCEAVMSPKFGRTFVLQNVPGRTLIEFHWGNTHRDTEGCILLAEGFDSVWDASTAVLSSRAAFGRFMAVMGPKPMFELLIEDCWGVTSV